MNPKLQKVIDEENALTLRGVPRNQWAYLAYNGYGDGLGTWTHDRDWILENMKRFPNVLIYGVVDGHDKAALTEHIYNSWKGHGRVTEKNGKLVDWTEGDSEAEWEEWVLAGQLERLSPEGNY